MTTAMIVRSILEGLAVIAIFIGLLNEEKLIRWEDKMIRKLRRSRRSKKAQRAKAAAARRVRFSQPGDWMHKPNRPTRAACGRLYLSKNHAA